MGTTLTVDASRVRFAVDGAPTFLLGASYYAGLGAPDEFVDRDLDELKRLGFNWIRVWATWAAFGNNVSAVDSDGSAREPCASRLRLLCEKAGGLGMIVDVTLSRGNGVVGSGLLPDQEAHLGAVATLARELKPFRNVYFDIGNERNIKDSRRVTFEELGELRRRIRETDRDRLVTASHAGDIAPVELREYLETVGVDFLSPHGPRNAESPARTAAKTQEYLQLSKEMGRVVPVHHQEPFRRDFGKWQPEEDDFLVDLRGAKAGGAAGWCFHNGDAREAPDGRPRRSFDMGSEEGRMFDQLDAVERTVVGRLSAVLKG